MGSASCNNNHNYINRKRGGTSFISVLWFLHYQGHFEGTRLTLYKSQLKFSQIQGQATNLKHQLKHQKLTLIKTHHSQLFQQRVLPYDIQTYSVKLIINNPIMNKSYLALALLFAAAAVLYNIEPSTNPERSQYLTFLKQFNKPIPSPEELVYRSRLYAQNLLKIEKHNSDPKQTWQMGVNQFSDLTQEEFVSTYLGEISNIPIVDFNEPVNKGFAEQVDWRNKGVITAVKNQGQCGSCWAFAATAAHESYQVQFKGQPSTISLSEQQLVDCSTGAPYFNEGCNGGYGVRALQWIKDHGQTVSADYPYVAVNQACGKNTGSYRIYGVAEIAGCDQIEEVLARRPLAVRVDASNWHLYKSGVFDNCNKNINHAVFLVGSSTTAWTIKNSWASTWGEQGYIRLAKGDTCAVCQGPSFPI